MLHVPMTEPHHPDARAPDRLSWIQARDVRLRSYEWGDPTAPPVLLCHGMFDHGRGFDRLAPHLADDYRVVAFDARGHGDSDWVDTYTWPRDVMDVIYVMRSLGGPVHLIGHSKGGGQATDAATLAPELTGRLINIDGFGPPDDGGFSRPGAPDLDDLTIPQLCNRFLDRRRKADQRRAWRAYATFDELVARRGQQNPLLPKDWLRYFVHHGARVSEDGWRWKSDPMMVGGGFGPFKPEWIAPGWQRLRVPMLAVVGSIPDSWGPLPEAVLEPRLAHVPQLERATIDGAGHFVHMERPAELADVILDFLAEA
jgi:pimeloyl-ACP methyl ester carboxylesterase